MCVFPCSGAISRKAVRASSAEPVPFSASSAAFFAAASSAALALAAAAFAPFFW